MQWEPPEALKIAAGESIQSINDFVNGYGTYRRDPAIDTPTVGDWSTPETFFKKKEGDCEDFALAKLPFLKELCGIDNVGLAVVYDLA